MVFKSASGDRIYKIVYRENSKLTVVSWSVAIFEYQKKSKGYAKFRQSA